MALLGHKQNTSKRVFEANKTMQGSNALLDVSLAFNELALNAFCINLIEKVCKSDEKCFQLRLKSKIQCFTQKIKLFSWIYL